MLGNLLFLTLSAALANTKAPTTSYDIDGVAALCRGTTTEWSGDHRLSAAPLTLDRAVQHLIGTGSPCEPHTVGPVVMVDTVTSHDDDGVRHSVTLEQRISADLWTTWTWTLNGDYAAVGLTSRTDGMASYRPTARAVSHTDQLPTELADQIEVWTKDIKLCGDDVIAYDWPRFGQAEVDSAFDEVVGYTVYLFQTLDPDTGDRLRIRTTLDARLNVRNQHCERL